MWYPKVFLQLICYLCTLKVKTMIVHTNAAVLVISVCLFTVRLAPCTPALSGPWKTHTKMVQTLEYVFYLEYLIHQAFMAHVF